MGKFIVIQKEKVERSEHSELIKTAISLLIKHGVATEIDTDQSIEERAIKRFPMPVNIHKDSGFAEPWRKLQFGYIKGATEQSLIEQMKAKEVLLDLLSWMKNEPNFNIDDENEILQDYYYNKKHE